MSHDLKPANMSSLAAKFCRAVVLAVILMPVGSTLSEAGPLTLSYSNPGTSSQTFNFGDYLFALTFETVNPGSFDVTVTDSIQTPTALAARFGAFPGYVCVPFANGGTDCVDFEVSAPAPSLDPTTPNTWSGFFDITVSWFDETNLLFPNFPGDRIRLLHNRGDVAGDDFDTDVTVPGSYLTGCPRCVAAIDDPSIGGKDDNFQSFTVVEAPAAIPEPATMFLLGSGLIGVLHQRTRRLRSLSSSARTPRASDPDPHA